ncbi:MAG: hypothetical protein FJ333_07825 [Sphingomonadales bacterium]|nr:hypothetical protein [Sphingomonadales bacterium]
MQLQQWVRRAAVVAALPDPPEPVMKEFIPKVDLPLLTDYGKDPGEAFWSKFPANLVKQGSSPIDAKKLEELAWAVGMDKDRVEKICADIRQGADIGCSEPYRAASVSKNTKDSVKFGRHVTDAVASWVKKKYVFGPVNIDQIPEGSKINGILVRPKPNGAVRVILNMSAPSGNSVNDGINAEDFPAPMSSTLKWLRVLNRAGNGCRMIKIDWADAYKHVPVRQQDIDLQWFLWLGKAFAELSLVFGTASSVGIYDRLAKLVLDIVLALSQFSKEGVCQHLDDVCAAAPAEDDSLDRFNTTYRKVSEQIGVQLAPTDDPEKAFTASTTGIVLGVEYDTQTWTWRIPQEKLDRLILQIRAVQKAEYVTQREIWSLAGRIMHYAPLIPTGRFNLDYVLAAHTVSKDPRYPVFVSPALKRQLEFWRVVTLVSSGFSKIPPPDTMPAWTKEVYSDAAGGTIEAVGRGVGVVCEKWWAYFPWSRDINAGINVLDGKKLGRKLSALELTGPLIAVAAGAAWCKNSAVRVWVDNQGSVDIWRKGYSNRCRLCTTIVKAIGTITAGINCKLAVQKIRRCTNTGAVLADHLSKANFAGFRNAALSGNWPLEVSMAKIEGPLLNWLSSPVVDDDLGSKILQHLSRSMTVLGYPC